jgi:hypothetical protein
MTSNRTHAASTHHKLAVTCFGRIELPQDDPVLGTYWQKHATELGVCADLHTAITLAEHAIAQPPLTLIRPAMACDFAPERITIRDAALRLVLAGEIRRAYLVWLPPITSDDETYTIRAAARRLRDDAAFQHGCDNYSTAEGLERRAQFLEGHLVDPVWQTEVTHILKQRAKSLHGLARLHPPIDHDGCHDFD